MSVDLPVLDVSHQWNHTLCALLCLLLSLSIVFSGSCQCVTHSVLKHVPQHGGTLLGVSVLRLGV